MKHCKLLDLITGTFGARQVLSNYLLSLLIYVVAPVCTVEAPGSNRRMVWDVGERAVCASKTHFSSTFLVTATTQSRRIFCSVPQSRSLWTKVVIQGTGVERCLSRPPLDFSRNVIFLVMVGGIVHLLMFFLRAQIISICN